MTVTYCDCCGLIVDPEWIFPVTIHRATLCPGCAEEIGKAAVKVALHLAEKNGRKLPATAPRVGCPIQDWKGWDGK